CRRLCYGAGARIPLVAKVRHSNGRVDISYIPACRWHQERRMGDMLRYLEEFVEPTIRDFEQHATSRRHAFLACVATFHAIDYLVYPKKSRIVRQEFG